MKLTISYLPTNRPNCCWKEDGRRTLHGDGRQSLAIGHLSISGDLKKICTVHTFSESIFPQITVALRRKLNHPHNLISHFWMPLETLAYCSSSIVKLQAKKIFRNSSLACICGKLSTFFQNVEHKSIPSTCTMAHLLGVFFVLLCLNEVSCSSFLGKIRKTLSFCLYCKFMHVFGHSVI